MKNDQMTMSAFIKEDNKRKQKVRQKIEKWEMKHRIREERYEKEIAALI